MIGSYKGFWAKVGRWKVQFDRGRAYLAILNSVMLISLVGWNWWYLVIIPFFFLFMWVDKIYIHPNEAEYSMTRSESFNKLTGDC